MSWVVKDLIKDLAEFLNISIQETRERIKDEWFTQFRYDLKSDYYKWMSTSPFYLYLSVDWHCLKKGAGIQSDYHNIKGDSICDFGSGIGTRGIFMALNGCNVTMIEINKPMIEFTKFRLKKHGIKNVIIKEKLNGSERFDYMLMNDVIGYLLEPIETMELIVSCIKKNGILVIRGWTNTNYTKEKKFRRNREIDFHGLVQKLGLTDTGEFGRYVKN